MDQAIEKDQGDSHSAEDASTTKHGINWEDPSIPIGNSPPMAKWPIGIWALAWAAWITFLFATLTGAIGG